MGTCRDCKWCIGTVDNYYMCNFMDELELVEDVVAECEDCPCDLYEYNVDVDN